ncbi:hypothetical protein [Halobellus rufus]|uniref:hypothetical protein n=1 Tax=Halobellus rufus TaxID=1448860 RepID=UPI0006797833|nr:hypothetical protein [Halobellus rufus]
MHAAILHDLGGDPTAGPDSDGTLTSELERRPYADVEATEYLDGRTVYSGTLAGYILDEEPNFYTDADPENRSLTVETDETERPVVTEFVADLETGWTGVDACDGAKLLETVLLDQVSCVPQRTELDLSGIVDTLPTDAIVEGVVTSEDEDEDGRDAAAALWGDEAPRSAGGIPESGLSQIAIRYRWDGHRIHATVSASGYVALYSEVGTDVFARWVSDVIWPHSVHGSGEADAQTELTDDGVCSGCGRESDDLEPLAIAPVDGPLCPVCRDKYREADGGMEGVES